MSSDKYVKDLEKLLEHQEDVIHQLEDEKRFLEEQIIQLRKQINKDTVTELLKKFNSENYRLVNKNKEEHGQSSDNNI